MKNAVCAAALILLIAGVAAAQDVPKVEVFGGYSLQRLGFSDLSAEDMEDLFDEFGVDAENVKFERFLKKGFLASVTFNATDVIGIEADFRWNAGDILTADFVVDDVDVTAKAKYSDFAFLVGPRFALRQSEAVTPFVHALLGVDRAKISGEASAMGESMSVDAFTDTGFAFALGGGLDVNINKNFGIRLIQADYFYTKHEDENMNNFSLAFGVVARF